MFVRCDVRPAGVVCDLEALVLRGGRFFAAGVGHIISFWKRETVDLGSRMGGFERDWFRDLKVAADACCWLWAVMYRGGCVLVVSVGECDVFA